MKPRARHLIIGLGMGCGGALLFAAVAARTPGPRAGDACTWHEAGGFANLSCTSEKSIVACGRDGRYTRFTDSQCECLEEDEGEKPFCWEAGFLGVTTSEPARAPNIRLRAV